MTHACRTLCYQLIAGALAVGLVVGLRKDWLFSFSLGLITMLVAQSGVVYTMWRFERKHQDPKRLVRWFYISQLLKYALLVAGVLCYVLWLHILWLPFLLGLFVVQLSGAMLTAQVKKVVYS